MDNIHSLTEKFSSIVDLQSYADKQFIALKQSQAKIRVLEDEISHLKSLLTSAPIAIQTEPELIVKSSEQVICEMEIEKLRQTSMERSLTLEETKRFDLLVKNLMIAKGKTRDIEPDYKRLSNLSEDALIALAILPKA